MLALASICHIPPEIYENNWVIPELSESDVKSNQGSDEDCSKISVSPQKVSRRKRSHTGTTISISSDSESTSETAVNRSTKRKGKS